MPDKPKYQLDDLFQQGAENYDFEYNSQAWENMEEMLDRDDRKRRMFIWLFVGLGMILLFGGIYAFYQKKNNSKELSTSEVARYWLDESICESLTELRDLNFPSPRLVNHHDQNVSKKELSEAAITQSSNKKEVYSSLVEINRLDDISSQVINRETFSKESFSELTNEAWLRQMNNFGLIRIEKIADSINIIPPPVFPVLFDSLHLPTNTDRGSRWFGHFTLGSELSSVKMHSLSAPNFKAGLQAEYKLTRKISTSAGLHYIQKKYEAGRGEYIPPKGFWTRRIAPNSTEGICQVLEIPLAASFYFKGIEEDKGFFLRGGVTSYFMLREQYQYFYLEPDPDLIRAWGSRFKNSSWLGTGEISLGYHQALSSRVALQVAPFLQIPFSGLGHGNVRLWNIGMNLNLRFQKKN
ncbi:MAG: hypothetical protein KDD99_02650 [Bacteroidetes bacterium]|nr:hypothetical protein [Bacteroidota bacterium]